MGTKCKQLRRIAIEHGMNSPEAREWRLHSKHCEKCRMEIFILDSLKNQAEEQSAHLGRNEVEQLMNVVRRNAENKSRFSSSLLLKIACILILLFSVFSLYQQSPGNNEENTTIHNTENSTGKISLIKLNLKKNKAHTPAAPPSLSETADNDMDSLRERVENQKQLLADLIDREMPYFDETEMYGPRN